MYSNVFYVPVGKHTAYFTKEDGFALIVDFQSELLDTLNTRLVIPLTPAELLEEKAPSHLCPVIHIDKGDFVIITYQMASVPTKFYENQ